MSLIETTTSPTASAGVAPRRELAGPTEAAARLNAQAWPARATALSLASVALFCAAAFLCWQASGSVVPWDSKNHFYPMFRFLADALHHGTIPLWNPYHFGGYPAIADPQSLIFTPSMVLLALVAPGASMQVFDAAILAHLCFGGLSVLMYGRHRRWHPAAAVLAAFVFMLGGSASGRLQHAGMIISYSFFPVALLMLEITLERCSFRFAALFALFASLMVLGRDQVAFLLAITLVGRALWSAAQSNDLLLYIRRRIGPLALASCLIFAVLGVPVLLTMQFLAGSNRPEIPFGVAVAGSLAPINFATLFAPNFFGSLDWNYDYWGPGYEEMIQPDWTDRSINYLFIGTLPILLVVWHGFASGRIFARGQRFFLAVLIAALLYAVGRYTPVFGFIFDHLPGVSLYRRPADATFVVNAALAFLSGYLLHLYILNGPPRLSREAPRWRALARIAATIVLVGSVIGFALTFSCRQGHLADSLYQSAIAVALIAFAAMHLFGPRQGAMRALAASLLVALSGGELIWRNAASSLNAEPLSRYSVYGHMAASDADGLAVLSRELAARAKVGDRPRVELLGLYGPWQNASMVLKLENTLGYNPLRIADYERAVGPGENAEDPTQRKFPDTFRGYQCKLASLLGLEYLVLGRPLAKLPRYFPRPAATQIYASDTMYIYRLGETAPRAYFASEIEPVNTETVLNDHALPDFDPTRQVLIDQANLRDLGAVSAEVSADGPSATKAVAEADPAKASVTVAKYEDNKVTIDVESDKVGIVVLHDIYYPGWRVRVDGAERPLLRANILFRGVEVPAGHHKVEFSFEPLSIANLTAAAGGLVLRAYDR